LHNKILKELNKSFDAYLVGGCVRDILMNKQPKDYDIVTSAKPYEIKDIFKNERISEVGESFKVVIVNNIEVATYRKDRYFGLSDKNVEISYADTLEEDLERRDLTINSIAQYKDKLIDPFEGQKDIKLRQLRFTGNADNRIYEDPCRILRFFRFCCLFPVVYNIDKNSYLSLQKNASLISHVKSERIRLEILKVMEYKQPSLFFNLLKEFNVLQYIFPELEKGWYHYDGNNHQETIFLHNMLVGDNISKRKPLLRLAGYLHDIGKPSAYNGENYKKHDTIGSEIVEKELKNLKFSTEEIKYIINLIDMHMVSLELSPRGVRKLFVNLHKRNMKWKDLIQLRISDRSGNLKNNNYSREKIKEYVLNIYKELNKKPSFSVKDLAINGNDVMKMLDLNPGPRVGKVLNDLFNKVIEDPSLNTIEQLCSIVEWNYKIYKT
jgi:tRNA nucleotidyltransferase (CCA-adding enzyme)